MALKLTAFGVAAPDPTREPAVGGAGVIVKLNGAEWVNPPEVAVIVTGNVPTGALLAADRVSTLAEVAGFGLNDADTPAGSPEATKLTELLKPNSGLIVTVLVVVFPC